MNNPRGGEVHERVNLTFPKATLRLLDRVSKKGSRSAFVDRAVRFYVSEVGRQNLRKHLQQGATKRAARDLKVAEEWFSIDEGVWQKGKNR